MEPYHQKESERQIKTVRLFCWFFIIYGITNFILFIVHGNNDQYGNPYMALWQRWFLIFNVVATGIIFRKIANKILKEIPDISHDTFELKFLNKIVSLFFIWTAITSFVLDLHTQTKINSDRAYKLYAIMLIGGIVAYVFTRWKLNKQNK